MDLCFHISLFPHLPTLSLVPCFLFFFRRRRGGGGVEGQLSGLGRRTRDCKVTSSNPGKDSGRGFFFFFFLSFCLSVFLSFFLSVCLSFFLSPHLTFYAVRCPFHPRVTAVARKRPRLFCKKCKWQVTPKHAYTFDSTKSERADYAVQA